MLGGGGKKNYIDDVSHFLLHVSDFFAQNSSVTCFWFCFGIDGVIVNPLVFHGWGEFHLVTFFLGGGGKIDSICQFSCFSMVRRMR